MRPTQTDFIGPPSSYFVHQFAQRLKTHGWWYKRIVSEQLEAAKCIDGFEASYEIRERIMRCLELCTRLMLLNRRALGFGLLVSVVINIILFNELPLIYLHRFPHWPPVVAIIFGGFLRIGLLLVLEMLFTVVTMYSGWYQRELNTIRKEIAGLDQADRATFRSDLTLISTFNQTNKLTADFFQKHVLSHRLE